MTAGVGAAVVIMAVPPLQLGMFVAGAIEHMDESSRYAHYAYRALPAFFLIPATFDSDAACDAFFATLKTKLEAARDAKRARIDAECRFWPCQSSDPTPCPDPVCERLRTMTDAQLASELGQLPALRAQVHIIATPD